MFRWLERNNIRCTRGLQQRDIELDKIYYNYEFLDDYYPTKYLCCDKAIDLSFYHYTDYDSIKKLCEVELSYEINEMAEKKWQGEVISFENEHEMQTNLKKILYPYLRKHNMTLHYPQFRKKM